MKAAVYAGTANLYSEMVTAAKSLAMNSSVDVIYFLIDTPEFPEPFHLPNYIQCIDVTGQQYFLSDGPNSKCKWTYMTMMRVTLADIFPDLDRILSLDVDTIVDDNIDELWDLNLDGYFMAAIKEPAKSRKLHTYVNTGVAMYNLDALRKNNIWKKAVYKLNTKKYGWPDQDCMNELCRGHILLIPPTYGANNYTQPCIYNLDNVGRGDSVQLIEFPKIIHFANEPDRTIRPIYLKYRDIPWEEIRKPCDI